MRENILDWFTGRDTFYLLGAGCSRCANKPLIGELTQKVLAEIGDPASALFKKLRPVGTRAANIEDLMNHVIRRSALLSSLSSTETLGDLSADALAALLKQIQVAIVKVIGLDWAVSQTHARFLSRIQPSLGKTRDIFSLNYDTLIEAALDDQRLSYSDGFRGTGRAWFDASTFEEAETGPGQFLLHKLHGSVTWRRATDGFVRRYSADPGNNEPVMVYPSEQKYIETRFGVYETLLSRFRARMRGPRPNNTLVTVGYSYGDDHINEAIFDAICFAGSNLTVFSFIGPVDGLEAKAEQLKVFEDFRKRCGQRLNLFISDEQALTTSVEPTEAKAILGLNLWKFEEITQLIAGAPNA